MKTHQKRRLESPLSSRVLFCPIPKDLSTPVLGVAESKEPESVKLGCGIPTPLGNVRLPESPTRMILQ